MITVKTPEIKDVGLCRDENKNKKRNKSAQYNKQIQRKVLDL